MTPKRGLNEKLLQFCGKFPRYPYTTWIFLEACVTLRNIQENMCRYVINYVIVYHYLFPCINFLLKEILWEYRRDGSGISDSRTKYSNLIGES